MGLAKTNPRLFVAGLFFDRWLRFAANHGNNVLDGDDKELVVGFEIDRNGVFWMEDDFVILLQRQVIVVFDGRRNGHDPAGDGGDLGRIGQGNSAPGLPLRRIFPHQDAVADGLHEFENFGAGFSR